MRRLIIAGIAGALMLLPAPAALAGTGTKDHQPDPPVTTNDDTDTVTVIVAGDDVIVISGSSGQPSCTYRKVRSGEIASPGPEMTLDEANEFIVSSTNANTFLYLVTCTYSSGDTTISYTWITETSPADEVARARAELAEILPPPDPTMSPATGVNHLVGLSTWVWHDAVTPITVTVEIPGLATTATATPATLRLDPGDGTAPYDCTDLGKPWTPNADAEGACTHTYQYVSDHSPTGLWDFTTTLTWDVTWTNTNGDADTADPIDTETITSLEVIELEARTTNG